MMNGNAVVAHSETRPAASPERIADYLTTGYWTERGVDGAPLRVETEAVRFGLDGLDAGLRDLARMAFGAWDAVSALSFREAESGATATVTVADGPDPLGAYTQNYFSDGNAGAITRSQVFLGDGWAETYGDGVGSATYKTLLHEIGHALGLGHAGGYNGFVDADDVRFANDSWAMSVMSYRDQREAGAVDASFARPITPMPADIAAIQDLYGAPAASRDGDSVYGAGGTAGGALDAFTGEAEAAALTIYDTGGRDRIDLTGSAAPARLDLAPGAVSDVAGARGNLRIAAGTLLEDARGGAAGDAILGNGGANRLEGGGGDDRIAGGGGDDWISGGAGDDLLFGGGLDLTLEGRGLADFGAGDGWKSQARAPRRLGDVDGDGAADIVAFGRGETLRALSGGDDAFGAPREAIGNFARRQGWETDSTTPRRLGDIDGDGQDDIVGFGDHGVLTALADGGGAFAPATFGLANFGAAQYWASAETHPRAVGDVDGDGRDDIVGFGDRTTFTALSRGDGSFSEIASAIDNFSREQHWTSFDEHPRLLGDIDNDGDDDLVGFGEEFTFTALATGDGTFGEFRIAVENFATADYWRSFAENPRALGDIDGDGDEDLVGFGNQATLVAPSRGDGTFGPARVLTEAFAQGDRWASQEDTPRLLGDVNADGADDIVGFARHGAVIGLAAPDSDTFAFHDGFGVDTVGDFGAGDRDVLDFRGVEGLGGIDDVRDAARQAGSEVVLETGGDALTLASTRVSELGAEDFVFG